MGKIFLFLVSTTLFGETIQLSSDVPIAKLSLTGVSSSAQADVEERPDGSLYLIWGAFGSYTFNASCSQNPQFYCSESWVGRAGGLWDDYAHYANVEFTFTVPLFIPGAVGTWVTPNFVEGFGATSENYGVDSTVLTHVESIALPSPYIPRGKQFDALITVVVNGKMSVDQAYFEASRNEVLELVPTAHAPEPGTAFTLVLGLMTVLFTKVMKGGNLASLYDKHLGKRTKTCTGERVF